MIHRPLALFTSLVLTVCTLVGIANGGQVIQGVNLTPAQQLSPVFDWNAGSGPLDPDIPVTVSSFDTSLGTLTSVQIQTAYQPLWWVRAENESAFPVTPAQPVTWLQGVQLSIAYRPMMVNPVNTAYCFGGTAGTSVAASGIWTSLSAYDGVSDFTGTSGFETQYGGGYNVPVSQTTTAYRELDWWSKGTTRTVYLSTRSITDSWTGWPGHWQAGHKMTMNFAGVVLVKYNYQ